MIAGVCLDSWGRGPLMLRDGKRVWWFEFSDMFGPLLLQAKPPHEPLNNQPCAEDHPFWAPFNRWMRAGKRHRPIKTKRGRLRFYLCYAPPEGLP